jgi:hypothetical protein
MGPEVRLADAKADLVEKLAAELKSDRECGQPVIYEREFRTGRISVTAIWDAWDGIPLQERSSTILRAYEMAEGAPFRDRIALASGLTALEARAAGMLPYQIIPALRKDDPVTLEQAREAFLEEGASQLINGYAPRLWFATEEEAEACRQRLIRRFPGSDDVWIINRGMTPPEPPTNVTLSLE